MWQFYPPSVCQFAAEHTVFDYSQTFRLPLVFHSEMQRLTTEHTEAVSQYDETLVILDTVVTCTELKRHCCLLRATAYMLSPIRLSVTRVDHTKMVEVRIMKFSPYSNPIPLVFREQVSSRNGGTAAEVPPPFRPCNPALCWSCPLVTPYQCRLGDLLCLFCVGYILLCIYYCMSICVFSCFH